MASNDEFTLIRELKISYNSLQNWTEPLMLETIPKKRAYTYAHILKDPFDRSIHT